jgi:gamma-glutamylcyclotransferase (GGCT)/AIG2-like uncharacterized protein YtfP
MVDLLEVKRWVNAANSFRWPTLAPAADASEDTATIENKLNAMFQINQTLAVYGTLAPGKPNHHIVAPYGGDWSDGIVQGDLNTGGWGSALGYPAFQPREGGSAVGVKVLKAPLLIGAWPKIDQFEGPEYQRILVLVFERDGQLSTVANLYACFQSVGQ